MPRPMKNSSVEWLGDIPAHWNVGKVSYFFDIQLGKMLQPESNSKTDTLENYLCAANLGGNKLKLDTLRKMWFSTTDKAKFDVRKGDLLVVEGGDVASCDVINEDIHDVYIQNALHRVRSNSGFDVRLLRYLLIVAKERGYIDLICNKATIAHFTKEKFANIPYLITPLDEQRRIATFLDDKCACIDSVIENTRASIEEYKKLKQSIITRSVTKGIRPNRPMKNSGVEWLGDIPSDWTVCRIKNLANIFTGNSIKDEQKEFYEEPIEAIPYIATKDIDATLQTIDFFNGMYVKISDESFKRAPAQSTLLCIEGGSAGKKIAYTNREVCFVNKLCCFHSNTCYNEYVYYYLMSSTFTQLFNSHISGLIGGVSVMTLKNFKIILPSPDEQREIANYLDEKTAAIDSLVAKKNQLVTELERLKKSLIFEYVTGKKEVPT